MTGVLKGNKLEGTFVHHLKPARKFRPIRIRRTGLQRQAEVAHLYGGEGDRLSAIAPCPDL